jgi:hypothetical protein
MLSLLTKSVICPDTFKYVNKLKIIIPNCLFIYFRFFLILAVSRAKMTLTSLRLCSDFGTNIKFLVRLNILFQVQDQLQIKEQPTGKTAIIASALIYIS